MGDVLLVALQHSTFHCHLTMSRQERCYKALNPKNVFRAQQQTANNNSKTLQTAIAYSCLHSTHKMMCENPQSHLKGMQQLASTDIP